MLRRCGGVHPYRIVAVRGKTPPPLSIVARGARIAPEIHSKRAQQHLDMPACQDGNFPPFERCLAPFADRFFKVLVVQVRHFFGLADLERLLSHGRFFLDRQCLATRWLLARLAGGGLLWALLGRPLHGDLEKEGRFCLARSRGSVCGAKCNRDSSR